MDVLKNRLKNQKTPCDRGGIEHLLFTVSVAIDPSGSQILI